MSIQSKLATYLIEADDAAWWKKLNKEERKDYIKEHPNSKYAHKVGNTDDTNKKQTPTSVNSKHAPGSKHRTEVAQKILSGAKSAVESFKSEKPKEFAEAASVGRNLKNGVVPKPSLLYKVGSTLAYHLLSTGALFAGTVATIVVNNKVGDSPSGDTAVVGTAALTLASAAFLALKAERRWAGYGGRYKKYDDQMKQHASTETDEQVVIEMYKHIAEFVKNGSITPQEAVKHSKK